MSDSVASALKLAAGLLLVVALISIAVILFNQASSSAKSAQESFAGIEKQLDEQQFVAYDNANVSGSVVMNTLRKFKDDGEEGKLGVAVKTGENSAATWYFSTVSADGNDVSPIPSSSKSLLEKAKDTQDPNYINPSGRYQANLVYDSSNVIRAITFVQK